MTNKTEITQHKKSEIAKGRERNEKGQFVKKGESVYCVSVSTRRNGLSKNCIEYFERMIRKARE